MKRLRYFEVYLNSEFITPAYTLEVNTANKAKQIAIKEGKMNKNKCIDIIEVDEDGNIIEDGYVSGTINL